MIVEIGLKWFKHKDKKVPIYYLFMSSCTLITINQDYLDIYIYNTMLWFL